MDPPVQRRLQAADRVRQGAQRAFGAAGERGLQVLQAGRQMGHGRMGLICPVVQGFSQAGVEGLQLSALLLLPVAAAGAGGLQLALQRVELELQASDQSAQVALQAQAAAVRRRLCDLGRLRQRGLLLCQLGQGRVELSRRPQQGHAVALDQRGGDGGRVALQQQELQEGQREGHQQRQAQRHQQQSPAIPSRWHGQDVKAAAAERELTGPLSARASLDFPLSEGEEGRARGKGGGGGEEERERAGG
jgi:hypothetical protein